MMDTDSELADISDVAVQREAYVDRTTALELAVQTAQYRRGDPLEWAEKYRQWLTGTPYAEVQVDGPLPGAQPREVQVGDDG